MKKIPALLIWISLAPGTAQAVDSMNPEQLYNKWCVPCHSNDKGAPGTLRLSRTRGEDLAVLLQRPPLSGEYMKRVVREGLGAMPLFRRSEISTEQLDSMVDYIIQKQNNFSK